MQLEKPGEFPAVLGIISIGKTNCSKEQEEEPLDPAVTEGMFIMEVHSFPFCA